MAWRASSGHWSGTRAPCCARTSRSIVTSCSPCPGRASPTSRSKETPKMPGQPGTLEIVGREVAAALLPLQRRLAPGQFVPFMRELGLEPPGPVASFAAVAAGAASTVASVAAVPQLVAQLQAAIDADDSDAIGEKGAELLRRIIDTVHGIAEMADGIRAAAGPLSAADRQKVEDFAEALPRRLFDYTVIEYLR